MKKNYLSKFLFLLVILLGMGEAKGQLVYEPFAGTGALQGQNSWATHSGTASQIQRTAGGLSLSGFASSSGNKVEILNTQSEDVNRDIGVVLTTGSLYASCLIRVNSTANFLANTSNGNYFMHFCDFRGTSFPTSAPFAQFTARLTVRQGGAANTFQLGIINNGGGTPTAADFFGSSPQNLNTNTTYLVVIKYTFASNTADLFISPTPGGTEPSPTHSSSFSTITTPDIESICIRNSNSANLGTGDMEIDELRVGTTWADVTPAGLSSVPASLATSVTSLDFGAVPKNDFSPAQSYKLIGAGLPVPTTGTNNVVVNAPFNFQVSRNNIDFSSFVSFTTAEINNAGTTGMDVFARFAPSSEIDGLKGGDISHSVAALTPTLVVDLTVRGRQTAPNSLADEFAAQTQVYPNPASKTILIKANRNYKVEIQDITGRIMGLFESKEIINVENLSNGLYLMQFSDENIKFVKRLVIQK